ncbi:MAG: hypothetical protein ACRD01_01595 [Terriglobales bacterium]
MEQRTGRVARRAGWTMAAMGTIGAVLLLAAPAPAQKLVLAPSSVVPAANIQLQLGRDDNGNTTVDLKAKHLAQPSSLSPARTVYVVWVQPSDGPPQRKGLLKPDNGLNAEVQFITPEQHFELIISAENNDAPATPSGTVVARSTVARGQ